MDIKPIHIILIVGLVLGLKAVIRYYTNDSVYRGPWYTVSVPKGWTKKVEKKKNGVIFSTPDTDPLTGIPNATLSIEGKKSKGALFLDDLFEEVMTSLREAKGGRILDASRHGELKVDGLLAKWVLYYREEDPRLMILTFFIVDNFNRLTTIQFVASPKNFKKYRQTFETFKDSIRFKKLF